MVKKIDKQLKLNTFGMRMKENLFKKYSNEEIAHLIYDEFVSDNSLTDDNVRKKFESFEELFWSRHQIEELLQIPELENRQCEIFDIAWFKIIELEKELVLKRNKVLNTKSNEELAEMLYDKVKTQADISSINLHMYYRDIGIEDFLKLPQATHERLEKIGNMVWQKVKELKKQRKHERIEKERKESFKLIYDIIEWVYEKKMKKLSKINLKLYLSEKKIDLAPVNRQALYLEVNKELESRPNKILSRD